MHFKAVTAETRLAKTIMLTLSSLFTGKIQAVSI